MSALLGVYLRHLDAAGRSPYTIDQRRRFLARADRALPNGIDSPTPDELADFLAGLGGKPWTRKTNWAHLSAFYAWATSGHPAPLDWNPLSVLFKPKQPRGLPKPVTNDELHTALARSNERWRLAITLGAWAGLRCGELAAAKREDFTAERIYVLGKGGKEAYLPTHPRIWSMVEPMPPGLLLPGRRGQQLTSDAMSTNARGHFKRIGMPGLHLHRFRHWHATALLRAGNDLRTVQELMRHESILSTQIYTLVTDGQRRFAVSTLPALDDLSTTLQDAA